MAKDKNTTMASNISKINTNGYKEETVSYDKTSTGANRIIYSLKTNDKARVRAH